MNCHRTQANLADYHHGSLSPADTALVRKHLAACPDCQREWSAFQEVLAHRALTQLRELYVSAQKEKSA